MRNLKISFLLAILTILFATFQSNAQAVHDEWIYDFNCEWNFFSNCLEEPVTGSFTYNVISHYDNDGNFTGWHFNVKGGKLTGCFTERKFNVIDSYNEHTKVNSNNDQYVYNLVNQFKLVGKKGEKYNIRLKAHVTINANGEVKVDYFDVVWCE